MYAYIKNNNILSINQYLSYESRIKIPIQNFKEHHFQHDHHHYKSKKKNNILSFNQYLSYESRIKIPIQVFKEHDHHYY